MAVWRIVRIICWSLFALGGVAFATLNATGCAKEQKSGLHEEEVLSLLSISRGHHRRSLIFLKLKQPNKALAELDKILALRFPKDFRAGQEAILDAWARKATLLLSLRRSDEAKKTIQEAITRYAHLPPSFYKAELHQVYGRILDASGDYVASLKAYQKSIEINKAVIRKQNKHFNRLLSEPERSKSKADSKERTVSSKRGSSLKKVEARKSPIGKAKLARPMPKKRRVAKPLKR